MTGIETAKTMKPLLILLIGICAVALGLALAIETGEIKGKVADESGAGLPGVEITAASPSLQGTRTVLSSKDGHFHFPLLPIGKYALTFKLQGFNTVIHENVVVRLGMVTSLDAVMTMATIRQEIDRKSVV